MKVSSWIMAVMAAGAIAGLASPAFARVSISRAEAACEAAALAQISPTPQRASARDVRISGDTIIVALALYSDDAPVRRATCTVNRDSGEASVTLTEAS